MQKRLWLAGSAVLIFILTLVVGNFFVPEEKAVSRKNAGHDFVAFYTAGTFVRTGQTEKIYDLPSVADFQHKLAGGEALEIGGTVGPFWNPPFYALVFVPLSYLPYHAAWDTWFVINFCCAAIAIGLMARLVNQVRPGWKNWGLVPVLVIVCMPFIQALSHGQNTCTSLLLLTVTISLWRAEKTYIAGIVCGLLFYKPQLGTLVAMALIILGGWRAFAGIATTGVVLTSVTLLALPGTLGDWFARMPGNIAFMQVDHRYCWERHVTLKAFWRLLLQGYGTGAMTLPANLLYLATTATLGLTLLATLWKARQSHDHQIAQRAMAATICAMPLLMPFYFDYDLLLLTVPATLYGIDRMKHGDVTRTLTAWIALFVWQYFNAPGAGMSRVNLTVVLLSVVSIKMIARARKTMRAVPTIQLSSDGRMAYKAAA